MSGNPFDDDSLLDRLVWMVRLFLLGILLLVGILGGALLVMRHLMGGCC